MLPFRQGHGLGTIPLKSVKKNSIMPVGSAGVDVLSITGGK